MIEFRNESQISAESFYVVRGVLAYVAEIGDETKVRGRRVARLRCIFENGTESNLLLQSLSRSLYDNGRRVTEPHAVTLARMGLEVGTPMGAIYVLRSLSTDAKVTSLSDLHKIGYTTTTTKQRLANANKASSNRTIFRARNMRIEIAIRNIVNHAASGTHQHNTGNENGKDYRIRPSRASNPQRPQGRP